MQRRRIQTSGQRAPAGRNHQVVSPGQSGDTIQQDHHVHLVLHQSLRTLDHHLGDALVVLRQFVKGGMDHLHVGAVDGLLDIRHLLGPLVNQQNQHMHLRIGAQDRPGHIL